MPVHEEIGELRRGDSQLRVGIEHMGRAFTAVKFHRNARIAKLPDQTKAAIDRDRRVLEAVKYHGRRIARGDMSCRGSGAALFCGAPAGIMLPGISVAG